MTFDVRLRAYEPGTDTVLGLLPETLSWDASVVHNNDGALSLKVSALADGGEFVARTLNDGLDVALEVNLTGEPDGWTEPDNCRFLAVEKSKDPADPAKVQELTLPSWSWLLNKICDLNTGALQGSKSKYAGQRLFPATSDAGDVMKKGLDEHDARSGPAVPIVRSSWTTTTDSLGHSWAKKLGKNAEGRAFPAGQPLHARLDALTTNGKCDWRTRGRGLRIYNPNTAFTNRSATVHLRLGDDLVDAPSKTSQADRVARLLVKGDGKHKVTVKDPTIPEHYGRWEGMIDSAGVKDDDDLEDAGQAELDTRNRIRGEYTRTLTMAGPYLPFRDYQVGDLVTAPGDAGDEVLKVMQITISRDSKGVLGGNVVLGDRFTAKGLATAARVSAITSGSSGVSGNGTTNPIESDTRQAAAPAGFTVTPSLVLGGDKHWSVSVGLSWSAVTTATDGTDLEVSAYRVWGKPDSGNWRELTSTDQLGVTLPGFVVGAGWTFAVSAVPTVARWESAFSTQVAVTLPADTTAPNKPSAPVVASYPAIVSIKWDGLDFAGAAMAADFARVDVLADTVSPPVVVAAQMSRGGYVAVTADPHDTIYVSLIAYDTTGNPSAATTPVSVVVKSVLDDTDLANRLATSPRYYNSDHEPPATPPALSWWRKADGTVWQYISGAWVEQASSLTGTTTAAQVIASLMAAVAATVGDLSADAATIQTLYTQALTASTAVIGLVKADVVEVAGGAVKVNATGFHGYNPSGIEKTTVGTDGTLAADSAKLTKAEVISDDGTYMVRLGGSAVEIGTIPAPSVAFAPTMRVGPTGVSMGPPLYPGPTYPVTVGLNSSGILEIKGLGGIRFVDQDQASMKRDSQTCAQSTWLTVDMDTVPVISGIITDDTAALTDLTGNRLVLTEGVWLIGGGVRASLGTAASTEAVLVATASADPSASNTFIGAATPSASGVHRYDLCTRVVLNSARSVYLRYKCSSATSHTLTEATLWAHRIA
ncbi:hypothetical protein ATK74_1745 [Propionicimonas paludicola]|uniref:Tail protein n=1 Tax=Propionicimonas paludicola TaxID=185243 RepID=A0A2A9CU62_9ACTN|nr:hypothetical protein ATK74_1745 [Propionicimonas paludicola]